MSARRIALACIVLSAKLAAAMSAAAHESHSPFENRSQTWQLVELNGQPFVARATLRFPEAGRIAGEAPCNRWFGEMRRPFPFFETGPLAATRMACPELDRESDFLNALARMSLAEHESGRLTLHGAKGETMVFRPIQPDG